MNTTEATKTNHSEPSATATEAWQCGNCLSQNDKCFCSHCGQARVRALHLIPILRQASTQFFDIDSPWRRTLNDVIRHPAKMVLDYIAGARKRYVNPVFFILIAGTLHWFALHTLVSDFVRTMVANEAAHNQVERVLGAMGYLAVVAALPAAWLVAKIGKQFDAAEYYVAMMYHYGLAMLVMPLFYLFNVHHWPWFKALNFLMISSWFTFVFSQMHTNKWRGGLIGFLSYLFLYVFVIIFASILLFGERLLKMIMQ